MSRREGGKIFGSGSRTPIAITLLVKNPVASQRKAKIFYHDIGDYLSREEKLVKIKDFSSILNPAMELSSIMPNEAHDWLNQRDELFETFPILGNKENKTEKTIFQLVYSCGVKTNRDSWVYNFSRTALEHNVSSMISFYNSQVDVYAEAEKKGETDITKILDWDRIKFSWDRAQRERDIPQKRKYVFNTNNIYQAMYRPFVKSHIYFCRELNNCVYQIPRFFPTPQTKNLVICVPGIGAKKGFSALMVDCIPDVQLQYNGQCFPLYYYEKIEREQLGLFDQSEGDYVRHDGVSDFILQRAREQYGPKCTKTDVFYYIYGLLHSLDYRTRFEADLTKMLPRIPLVEDVKTFRAFSNAGRELAEIHLNYETAEPWKDTLITGVDSELRIEKMRFSKTNGEDDKRTIILNAQTKVENIPLQAYDYVINGKSALEWLMERYSYSVHPESHIANDPNAWGQEHAQPHYVLNLLLRIITVSMKTLHIVSKLPKITFPTN